MVDLTRDEWDDMQGWEDDGGPAEFIVECARCGKMLDVYKDGEVFLEEGDEWECESCNIRCDAIEYYEVNGLDIDFDNFDIAAVMA